MIGSSSKPALRLWTGPADPAAAVDHAVPHTVVPQLLRRLVAACLSPEEVHLHTLRDATCCVTALTSGTSSLFDGGNEAAFEFEIENEINDAASQGHSTSAKITGKLSGFLLHRSSPQDTVAGSVNDATPRRFDDLTTTFPHLTSLDLEKSSTFVDFVLSTFAASRSLPLLRVIVMHGAAMTPAVAATVAAFHSLAELHLVGNCTDVKSDVITALASLPALAALDLRCCPNLDAAFFEAVAECRALRHLTLHRCAIVRNDDDVLCPVLAPLPHLESLELSHCTGIKIVDLERLSAFVALRRITLSRVAHRFFETSGEGFRCIGDVPSLEAVVLTGADVEHADDLRHLARLPHLRVLSLRRSPVGPDCCAEIAKIQHLEELHLPCCYQMDSRGLALIAADPVKQEKLKLLDISYNRIDGTGLACLTRFRHLKELHLSCSGVNNNGLATLSRIASLETLNLRSCEGFDIQGVRKVARLPKLRKLDLTYCKGLDMDMRKVHTAPQEIHRLVGQQ